MPGKRARRQMIRTSSLSQLSADYASALATPFSSHEDTWRATLPLFGGGGGSHAAAAAASSSSQGHGELSYESSGGVSGSSRWESSSHGRHQQQHRELFGRGGGGGADEGESSGVTSSSSSWFSRSHASGSGAAPPPPSSPRRMGAASVGEDSGALYGKRREPWGSDQQDQSSVMEWRTASALNLSTELGATQKAPEDERREEAVKKAAAESDADADATTSGRSRFAGSSPWRYGADADTETWEPSSAALDCSRSAGDDDFLRLCSFCRRSLERCDIFMYRGDKAFCSQICRQQQIAADERTASRTSASNRLFSMVPMLGANGNSSQRPKSGHHGSPLISAA